METALCTEDNSIYTANNFNQIENFFIKKRFLVCTECNGPAFFRGPSRNGREACFGARPHAEGCTLATQENDGVPTGQGIIEDEIITTGQRIVVDFNYGTTTTETGIQPTVEIPGAGRGRTFTGEDITLRPHTFRRLSPLLYTLVTSEIFRSSDQIIQIPGQEANEYTVRDLFVNFSDITENHLNNFHGFWGMIPDARTDRNGTLWFNSGGRENVSVFLDQRYVDEIFQRFHIVDEEEIAGAYLMVFGVLKRAANGKQNVQITDPNRFVLRLAR